MKTRKAGRKDVLNRTSLHRQITELLRQEVLEEYQPGDRFGSQNALAKRFAVSPLTIREAVGALVQEGLLERRLGSGTYVLDPKLNKTVGILIELDISRSATSYFYLRVVQQVAAFLTKYGQMTRIYVGHAPELNERDPELPTSEEFWDDLENNRLRAIVPVGTMITGTFRSLLDQRRVMVAGEDPPGQAMIDYAEIARRGIRYLIENDCTKIALIEKAHDANSRLSRICREELQAAGLELRDDRHAWISAAGECRRGRDGLRKVWRARDGRPDGMLVLDDTLYRDMGEMLVVNRISVPEDLLVITHANKGDPQRLVPVPARLEVDPDQCAAILAEDLLDALGNLEERSAYRPAAIAVVPHHAAPSPELIL